MLLFAAQCHSGLNQRSRPILAIFFYRKGGTPQIQIGLGLTITTRLVQMMGGKIWLESLEGVGSHFHFTMRFNTSQMKGHAVAADASLLLRGAKALVVDDNRTNRRILEGMFANWGMNSKSMDSAAAALAELAETRHSTEPYSLIVTDMHMPEMDGFGLVDSIRKDPGLSVAQIIMLTSGSHRGDIERCKSLGIAAFLSKPIRQAELRDAMLRVLESDPLQPKAATVKILPLVAPTRPASTGASLGILLAEDNAVNQKVAARLLEKLNHHVTVAGNGLLALEALNQGSFDLVFMDVQMPEMDGMEATATIRAQEKLSGTHQIIVALTAHSMMGDRERCIDGGMDDYLTKPIRREDLDVILRKYAKTEVAA